MAERQSHLIDLAPLRASPAYARLWAASTLTGVGAWVTLTAVALHIYALTQSTFAVSLVAWYSLFPMILAGLYGGAIADRFDRRTVTLVAATVAWLSTLVLLVTTATGWVSAPMLYAMATLNAVAATIASTARGAIVPRLLPLEMLAKASALNGIAFGLAMTVGPGLAGILVARVGYAWTYSVDVVLFFAGFFGLITLPSIKPDGTAAEVHPIRSILDGLAFLRQSPNVRTSFVVDIIAMTFGMPLVILPAVGATLLGGGPMTVGVLQMSWAIGGIVSSLVSGRLTSIRHQGLAIRNAIAAYGVAIASLGVVLASVQLSGQAVTSSDFAHVHVLGLAGSCLALACAGGADNVSSIFRNAVLQAAVPDALRGRLQGIFISVVAGGPRVGQMFAGTLAALTTLWMPPLAGGIAVVVLVFLTVARARSFRAYDALNPTP